MAAKGPRTRKGYMGRIQAGMASSTLRCSAIKSLAYWKTATRNTRAAYSQKETRRAVINQGPVEGTP